VQYSLGVGFSSGLGIKDDAACFKLLGCGLTLGGRLGVSFFDMEVGVDLRTRPQEAEEPDDASSEERAKGGRVALRHVPGSPGSPGSTTREAHGPPPALTASGSRLEYIRQVRLGASGEGSHELLSPDSPSKAAVDDERLRMLFSSDPKEVAGKTATPRGEEDV
jgi:hypothetical protein